ncbi:hypothetical protein EX30DRAFT_199487 [Ascodesmis nigricans]|uniref:Nephrocystin 3-like N-terminal domain-containing protein n=1 Tax=Ascodesmis nigricans TaxID=341454 RepID=A0A4S2MKN4_9PEZI|nr:hypothetical protein EX30DRAFT_199487 [Ascodesmis nigricans]
MVTKESATALSWDPANQLPIDGDHSTIVKFSHSQHDGYRNVLRRLKSMVQSAVRAPIAAELSAETIQNRRIYRDWLKATDPLSEYMRNLRNKAKGTCGWVFQTKAFQEFIKPTISSGERTNLWIKGKPGAGKSVLSAAILEHLSSTAGLDNFTDGTILYFFFRNGDYTTSKASEMIASLIDQILVAKVDNSTVNKLVAHAMSHYEKEKTETCRSIAKLWTIFVEMVNLYPKKILVVLDALDECDDRADILDFLITSNHAVVQFLVTSRPDEDIIEKFNKPNMSCFQALGMAVDEDIRSVVLTAIDDDPRLSKFKTIIVETIDEKSEGMFRYAALLLEELRRSTGRNALKLLKRMPKGLSGMYERIIVNIPEHKWPLVKLVLLSIALAVRPLTVNEAAYMLAVGGDLHDEGCELDSNSEDAVLNPEDADEDDDFDPENFILDTGDSIVQMCAPLVEINSQNELRFTHLSVKDFILQSPHGCGVKNQHDHIRIKRLFIETTILSIFTTCKTKTRDSQFT